jgi:hypothetical protein
MDESYIHKHYHRNDDSLWDPNDDQDIVSTRAPAKGRRYYFCAAIQGLDPRVDPSTATLEVRPGHIPGSILAFCPQRKGDHQGDYHKVFNGENFFQWWRDQLLPNLHQPSIIYLENAAYHLIYGDHVPKASKMRKHECMYFLQSKGVDFDSSMSALELKKVIKDYIASKEKIEIVCLAELEGHRVELTPPYHSDFQPIEIVWALIKGNVGRQYDINTSLTIIYNHLMHEFDSLLETGHASIGGMIEKCASIAWTFYDEMDQEEEDVAKDDSSTKNSSEPAMDPYETDTDDKFDAWLGMRGLLGEAARI